MMDVVEMLRGHLAKRIVELRTELAAERLAGNSFKEGRARAALVELYAIKQILIAVDHTDPG
jgi:hypothetical protein